MRAANDGCSELWISDTQTGKAEKITDRKGQAEDAAWSPDGTQLAFYGALDGTARLWVWNRTTKRLRRVGNAIMRPSLRDDGARPQWTPDGKRIVALVLPEGMTVEQANARIHPAAGKADGVAAASGTNVIVYRASPASPSSAGPAAPQADVSIRRQRSDLAAIALADVALIDVSTGNLRRIDSDKAIFWYAPSPDGKWIAYSHIVGARQDRVVARVYDIDVAPIVGGAPRHLARDVYPDQGTCTWSPDGTRLAYASGVGKEAIADIHVIDVETGRDRKLTPNAPLELVSWMYRLVPLWMPDGKSLVFSGFNRLWRLPLAADNGKFLPVTPEDPAHEIVHVLSDASGNGVWTSDKGRSLTVTTRNPATKDVGFFRVELASGQVTKLLEEPRDFGFAAPVVSADGTTIVYGSEDSGHPRDLWVAGPDLANTRQLTHINPQADQFQLGRARVIDYLGGEGQPLRGALLLPAAYQEGTRVPMVVQIYPGEWTHSNEINRFGLGDASGEFNMQMLATRGYAVLYPETPQRIGSPMRDLAANTNAAINRVIEMGIADPKRLAVMGQSYGGFSTLSLLTQTDRFRAAVMSGGYSDLTAFYGEMQDSGLDSWVSWAENEGKMAGSPWQYRERYIENSPIFYLDRVTTPLLILHGAEDTSVRVYYAGQVFSGLRKLGREVEFRKYPGEGHVLEAREHIIDYWDSVIRWFDGHLRK